MLKRINLTIIAILFSTLALKTNRYSNTIPEAVDQSVEHKISDFMAHHGWQQTQKSQQFDHGLFKSMTYTTPRCGQLITIAILGDNRELHNFVISALGEDLAILENNIFSNSRTMQNLGLHAASATTVALLRTPEFAPLPPLAISPAPNRNDNQCDTPKTKHWLNWSKNWH